MKKLLNGLLTISILASSSTSVVSCNHGHDKKGGGTQVLSNKQKQMIQGAEFMTKLILAGRHENLNYNVNEVLTSFLDPVSSLSYIPTTYNYDGKPVDLATSLGYYKNLLAPAMGSFDKDNYAGVYASYIMGMYTNSFYQSFAHNGGSFFNDVTDPNGHEGYNKTDGQNANALGYAAGLLKDDKLASDADRKSLAWGIQDTGALTNYLLYNGFDGGFPDTASGTASPNGNATSDDSSGGTNASGYLYYNSLVANGVNSRVFDGKAPNLSSKFNKNSGLSFVDHTSQNNHSFLGPTTDLSKATLNENNQTLDFGETGTKLAATGCNLNIQGHSASYAGYLNLISNSQTGASTLGLLSNVIFPILKDDGSSKTDQGVGFSIFNSIFNGIWKNDGTGYQDKITDALNFLSKDGNWDQYKSVSYKSSGIFSQPQTIKDFFEANDKTKALDSIKTADNFFDALIKTYDNATQQQKESFAQDKTGFFNTLNKAYKTIINAVGKDEFDKIVNPKDGSGAINLISLVKAGLDCLLAKSSTKDTGFTADNNFDLICQLSEKYNKPYKKLTQNEKNTFLKILGWNGTSFDNNSYLSYLYKYLNPNTKERGYWEFKTLIDSFENQASVKMKDTHEKLIQYMTGNTYWKDSDLKVSADSNSQPGETMSFTLDYNGVGDSTSIADKQTNKVDVSDNFNPYQTIYSHQKDELKNNTNLKPEDDLNSSGKVLGIDAAKKAANTDNVDEALKDYDGTGMFKNMKTVKHQYKVSWTNVSDDVSNPYWVITSIHCFNADGKEFYNIY